MSECPAQSSAKELPPATDGKNTETHNQTCKKKRDLGTLSPKEDVSIKSLLSGLRDPCERGGAKSIRARGKNTNRIATHMNLLRLSQHA